MSLPNGPTERQLIEVDKDTLFDEILAFYEQQKDNAECIKKLGHVEYRMWGFIKRIAIKGA